jgi:hypothetical protein
MNKKYKFDPTNPTASYESRNTSQMDALTNQYMNRGAFSYDSNTDKAFQDYANIMLKNGNMAMKDTAAKAASKTGGYGNSYAQSVGQQVYNDYVDQIGLAEGDFYDRALAKYNAEGNDLLSKLGLLERQEARDKAAWEDDYANAYAMAQNAATYNGDYSGLAKFLGTDAEMLKTSAEEAAKTANRKPLTEEQINGYRDALILGNGDAYFNSLVAMGYDTDNLYALADSWSASGLIAPDSITNNGGEVSYGTPAKSNADINAKITGLNNTKKGQNFHVEAEGENWDVQIGNEITDENSYAKKYGKDKTGLFVYNNSLYYSDGNGGVFAVEEQPWRKFFDGKSESDLETLIRLIGG